MLKIASVAVQNQVLKSLADSIYGVEKQVL